MNKFKEKERFVQCMKDSYPPGTRLVMLSMDDPYAPIPSGTRETQGDGSFVFAPMCFSDLNPNETRVIGRGYAC